MTHRNVQPDGWPRPSGYSNGIVADGLQIFVAGQIGWDVNRRLVSEHFLAQARQALLNVVAVLDAAGAGPEHVVRMTWYVTDIVAYRSAGASLGTIYREVMGNNYPAMSAVQVVALAEVGAVVEIEATAVVAKS